MSWAQIASKLFEKLSWFSEVGMLPYFEIQKGKSDLARFKSCWGLVSNSWKCDERFRLASWLKINQSCAHWHTKSKQTSKISASSIFQTIKPISSILPPTTQAKAWFSRVKVLVITIIITFDLITSITDPALGTKSPASQQICRNCTYEQKQISTTD